MAGRRGLERYLRDQDDDETRFYYFNTRHDEDHWIRRVRVGEDAVRNAVIEHIEVLLDLSDHPLGPHPVSIDEAKDRLYNRSCPKTAVKRRLLKPLAELGFISVRAARIVVYRRTIEQVEIVEA